MVAYGRTPVVANTYFLGCHNSSQLETQLNLDMDLFQCLSTKIRLSGTDANITQQVAQITAYAPESFAKLRSYFKISEASFRRSIFESGPYISFQSNSKGAARSGRHETKRVLFGRGFSIFQPEETQFLLPVSRWRFLFYKRWSLHD